MTAPPQRPTVPKRRVTVEERRLTAAARLLDGLATDYPAFMRALAVSSPALLRSKALDRSRGTDIPDPTSAIALHADHAIADINEAINGLLIQARWIHEQMQPVLAATRRPPSAGDQRRADADKRDAMCDADPLCPDYGVRDGKCWRHYRAALAAERDADVEDVDGTMRALSTVGVLETATFENRAPGDIVAECGRCGWTTPALDIEHAKLLLEEHHRNGCPSRPTA